ncbi:single-stranded DNA-binding protein [Demequina sp. NBRC 110056]|uniref:single-stranded DNA-binding protein n=1 Tax=Demequina sp. NBRC 110056 TaxID=1570345 RepID=UPI0013566052|nr:single-stranded DNA-binding protein [Demequina sp. NBRC 110056]
MNDLTTSVTGWVGNVPTLHTLADGKKMVSFRMGHTPSYRTADGTWKTMDTQWLSVRMFRTGAQNVSESIRKGDPVFVQGRLRTNVWVTNDGTERTDLQLEASTVGHDLTWGTTRFSRTAAPAGAEAEGDDEADGSRAEDADAEESVPEGLDPADLEAPDVLEDAPSDEELTAAR